ARADELRVLADRVVGREGDVLLVAALPRLVELEGFALAAPIPDTQRDRKCSRSGRAVGDLERAVDSRDLVSLMVAGRGHGLALVFRQRRRLERELELSFDPHGRRCVPVAAVALVALLGGRARRP